MRKNCTALRYLLGTSLIAMSSTPVLAQAAAEADDGVIIVTANKREQTLQETPIAITAVTAEQVEIRGISETKDLAAIAPGVSVSGGTTNATAAVVTIRGIPTPADETMGYDSPIGLYLDGVYLARQSAASFEVADIERVEILRGPQGTLFGRNTTGGAINYITKRPSDDANLKAKFGYGNYDQKTARIIANTGDLGGVRISGGYLYKARDGVVDNLLESKDSRDPGSYKTHGARLAFEADLSDSITLTNIFDWTKTTGVPVAQQLGALGDGTFRPNVTIGGNTFAQVQPANVLGYLSQATVLEPECGSPLDSVSLKRLDKLCLESAEKATDKIYGNMTRLEWEGDYITVRSTTAFRWWKNRIRGSDLDGLGTLQGALFDQTTLFNGMPEQLIGFVLPPEQAAFAPFIAASPVPTVIQPLFQANNTREQEQFSQEIEIVGGSGTSFEWVLGGFYFQEDGSERNPQSFAFILDTNQAVFSDASFGPLGAGFRAANPARFRAIPITSVLDYGVKAKSYAIYGQGTYRPGGPDGALGITLGLRYTWDKKRMTRLQNGAAPFGSAAELAINDRRKSFSEPTGHVTIDYEANRNLNLYAKAARGYRSGGFNARQSTQLDNAATTDVNEEIALIPFNEEKIDSFEIGAKANLGRARINVAAFHSKYSDLQVTVPIPIVGGGSFGTQVVNAGKNDYTGVEIEAAVDLTDAITFDGAFGYIDRNVKEFPAADINGVLQNIGSVIKPGISPSTTAAAALTYSDYLGDSDTRMTARLGWTYTSKQYFFGNPLTAPFSEETKSGSRSLFNAQLRFDGIKVGPETEISVQLWGKNIFDKEYVSRSVDFGQLGYGGLLFGDPATYGIDVEFKF
ncbi:MAG: TonB-dependent receptor [Novosphingobium sp.]|nr:TonB-dependent receptor [Novosphingobium sp.]